jgi:hypothetical protein
MEPCPILVSDEIPRAQTCSDEHVGDSSSIAMSFVLASTV